MDNTAESQPRISKIWAKNFRSIENFEMELDPLTVLVGPNASGKSNVVDVLRFMSDTAQNGLESALTTRRVDQVARRSSPRIKATDIEISVNIEGDSYSLEYEFVVRVPVGSGHKVIREKTRLASGEIRSKILEIEIRNGRLIKPQFNRPDDMPTEVYDGFKNPFDSASREIPSIAFPFNSIIPGLAFFRQARSLQDTVQSIKTLNESDEFLADMRFYHIFLNVLREPKKLRVNIL